MQRKTVMTVQIIGLNVLVSCLDIMLQKILHIQLVGETENRYQNMLSEKGYLAEYIITLMVIYLMLTGEYGMKRIKLL